MKMYTFAIVLPTPVGVLRIDLEVTGSLLSSFHSTVLGTQPVFQGSIPRDPSMAVSHPGVTSSETVYTAGRHRRVAGSSLPCVGIFYLLRRKVFPRAPRSLPLLSHWP